MGGRSLADRLLDASVIWSFDRTGYRRHARRFHGEDLSVDLSGRVCLITGANSGIGFATARALASRGADTWLLCRDAQRGASARDRIQHETGSARVYLATVDVSRLEDVRAFARGFAPARVDVLVHNAGVLPRSRIVTVDGLELTFATHVAGPFVLTLELLAKLRAAAPARVVFVSSGGMYARRLDVGALERITGSYDGVEAYAQTKRAQVVLAELLAGQLSAVGVTVNAMHPGWVDTPSVRMSLPRFYRATRSILRNVDEGADTLVWLAVCPTLTVVTGRFFFDRQPRRTHWLPWTRESAQQRSALWNLCLRLAGRRCLGGALSG